MIKQKPIRFGSHDYLFSCGFVSLSFFIVFFSLLCAAGFWQLDRYHFKKELVVKADQKHLAATEPFTKLDTSQDLQFQNVSVKGQYLSSLTLLMQNQIRNGHVGFEVFTPLKITGSKKLLLVDRGWIEKPATDELPTIKPVITEQNITGYLKNMNDRQFILGKNILNEQTSPLVMQKLDIKEISRITHSDYYPYLLRLDPGARNGFLRQWIISTMPPERHLGYAVQWFVMALVFCIAYLCLCCERVIKND